MMEKVPSYSIENFDTETLFKNLIEIKTLPNGMMEYVIIVYDEDLYLKDVVDGEAVERKFPELRADFRDMLKSPVPIEITRIFAFDVLKDDTTIRIKEYHIPLNSRFVKPCHYEYDKNPLLYKTNTYPKALIDKYIEYGYHSQWIPAPSNLKADKHTESVQPSHIPAPEPEQIEKPKENLFEKYAISEDDYWKNEKEYLANEDEDFPYFVASLLNSYGMDKIVFDATPDTSAYDILFCHLIKSTQKLSALKFLPRMQELYEKGFISCPFSENTFTRSLSSSNARKVLEELLSLSAVPFIGIDREFAIDSSGFTTVSYAQWYRTKYAIISKESIVKPAKRQSAKTAKIKEERREERQYVRKPWLKASIVIGRTSHAVFALDLTSSHGKGTGDSSRFEKTVTDASKFFVNEDTVLTADKIYNTNKAYDVAENLGFRFICDFKKNTKGRTDCSAMTKAYHFRYAHPEIFKYFYGGRNNVESVFNAIKNKVGERVFANSDTAVYNEMYCKMIAYNLMALIRLYYMCGIGVEWRESA